MTTFFCQSLPTHVLDFAAPPRSLTSRRERDSSQLRQHLPSSKVWSRSALSSKHLCAVAELQSDADLETRQSPLESGSLVLVAGSTGGVGQLLTARLLADGYRVRATTRNTPKAEQLFGKQNPNLEIMECDFRNEEEIPKVLDGVDAVCSCIGTTAFPSTRWEGNNNPEMTDKLALGNLVKHTADIGIKRFVLVSSVGVTRSNQFPYSLLNSFKVLTYRRLSEEKLMDSGLPWTIIRPCRLTDGPYTSYDLNTLIKGKMGARKSVHITGEDNLSGEASRITVAEAIVQCLHIPETINHAYSIESVRRGSSPEQDTNKWTQLFQSC